MTLDSAAEAVLHDTEPFAFLVSSDDNYVMPLAVALFSTFETLGAGCAVNLYIMDGGISTFNRSRLEQVLSKSPVDLHLQWIEIDEASANFPNLPSGYLTSAANYRLLAPLFVPDSRVLYLDCDVVVRRSLREVFATEFDGHLLAAVQDSSFRTIDASVVNWREQGLDPKEPYFNSGVLLMNLDMWREEASTETILKNLREYADIYRFHDQDALNAVFCGRFLMLDGLWNSQIGSPVEHPTVGALGVLHYTSQYKPWLRAAFGPLKPHYREFHTALKRTRWFSERDYIKFKFGYYLYFARTAPGRLLKRLLHTRALG